jgi:hypothetical protein
MAMKKTTIVVEEQYANLLESLPNKSRIINTLLALLFSNVNENDLMKIAYASHHNESLRKELQNILQRNMGMQSSTQPNKTKSNKIGKQTIKETKEKEPIGKKSISFESWWY